MKTNSTFTRSLTAVHLAVVLALAAPPVFGQAAGRNTDGEKPARTAADVERANLQAVQAAREKQKLEPSAATPSLFEIEIVDGTFVWKGKKLDATLENVVDMVRERHEGANIVLSPALPKIRIANLKLRATSVEQELEALRVASGGRFIWNGPTMPPAIDPLTGLPVNRNESRTPLYVLNELSGNQAPPGRRVEVFNLTDYFNSLGSADEENHQKLVENSLARVQQMITATLDVMDENHNASLGFQFHAGANLLVVVGTSDALEVARKVISALGPQPRPFGSAGGPGGIGFGGAGPDPFGNPYRSAPPGNALSSASSKARRAIMNKLEAIRLETAGPWELPLAEVVKLLNDEAKKRDPEKRGINFLINPNAPLIAPVASVPGAPPAIDPTTGLPVASPPPIEQTDINSVIVKIALPLTNVRLVDILDAIVKVADHPIRYTITDYAVVFSLRGPESAMNETPFPGAASGFAPALP